MLHMIQKYITDQFYSSSHLHKSKVTMSVSAILLILFEAPCWSMSCRAMPRIQPCGCNMWLKHSLLIP